MKEVICNFCKNPYFPQHVNYFFWSIFSQPRKREDLVRKNLTSTEKTRLTAFCKKLVLEDPFEFTPEQLNPESSAIKYESIFLRDCDLQRNIHDAEVKREKKRNDDNLRYSFMR